MILSTERLTILPLEPEQLLLLMQDIPQLEHQLKLKYRGEKIDAHLLHAMQEQYMAATAEPSSYLWNTFWLFILKEEKAIIGSACFKGAADENGDVEIGYGISQAYERKGYTSEAAAEMCRWALKQPDIRRVIAETEKANIASHKVLQNCGMTKYKEIDNAFWWELYVKE